MNISLTPELEEFVQAKVRSGGYSSASEVVHVALHLLEQHERLHAEELRELRSRVDYALASLARGEGADGASFMQNLLDDVGGSKKKRKAG